MGQAARPPLSRLWLGFALCLATGAWSFVSDPDNPSDPPDSLADELLHTGPMVVALLLVAATALLRLRSRPRPLEAAAPDAVVALGAVDQIAALVTYALVNPNGTAEDPDYVTLWIVGVPALLFGLVWASLRRPVRHWMAIFNLAAFGAFTVFAIIDSVADAPVAGAVAMIVGVVVVWVWAGLGLARLFTRGSG